MYYWYFLSKAFKCQTCVCNRCHDLLMMSTNLSDIAILNIKNADYRCIIKEINKSKTIKLLQNIDSTEKKWNIIKKLEQFYKNIKSSFEAINLLEILI